MTREEVKAQLAKNPLEWRETLNWVSNHNEDIDSTYRSNHIELSHKVSAFYEIKIKRRWCSGGNANLEGRVSLVIENEEAKRLYGDTPDEYLICEARKAISTFVSYRIEELESMAESHRLELLCQMLGIND